MTGTIKILWLYPDILNLHGDRGNLMALERIAGLLGLPVEIVRVETPDQALPLESADLLMLCSGEVKDMARIVSDLAEQKRALRRFAAEGGYIFAIGSSGAVLARETRRRDGNVFGGLDLLPMYCRERDSVWGDDLWFSRNDTPGAEIIGNQIQVLDIELVEPAQTLGKVIYGRGNNGGQDEGCRAGNIVFTNTLGPLFVKNPRYTADILTDIANRRRLQPLRQLTPCDTEYEDKSFVLIKHFIEKKMA